MAIERAFCMTDNILVINYGVGNLQSVENALLFLGAKFRISGNKKDVAKAKAYIFPGVGAFGEAVQNFKKLRIEQVLREQVLRKKKPILGICLGMQLMGEDSQEDGLHKGLGWIPGHVVKLGPSSVFRIPHVGWNTLQVKKRDPLFAQLPPVPNFYFDHSYHLACPANLISATAWHGVEVVAAIQNDHIFGVQFHPEKSQSNGLKFLRAFLNFVHTHSNA